MKIIDVHRLATVLLAIVLAGCGGPTPDANLGQVSGTVMLDGNPLAGAYVSFQPESGRPSSGRTDEAGKYTLSYTEYAKGAVVGAHSVTVTKEDFAPGRAINYSTRADVQVGSNTVDLPLTTGQAVVDVKDQPTSES